MTNLPTLAESPQLRTTLEALPHTFGHLFRVSAWTGCAWSTDRDEHDTQMDELVNRTERCLLQCVRSDSEPDRDIYAYTRLIEHDDTAIEHWPLNFDSLLPYCYQVLSCERSYSKVSRMWQWKSGPSLLCKPRATSS